MDEMRVIKALKRSAVKSLSRLAFAKITIKIPKAELPLQFILFLFFRKL